MKISILDLEQRINPIDEYLKLSLFLEKEPFIYNKSFISFIDQHIRLLSFAGTSISFNDYFADRGINLRDNNNTKEATTSLLYIISFILTFWDFMMSNEQREEMLLPKSHSYLFEREQKIFWPKFINIVNTLLPALNYQTTEEDTINKYGFKTPLLVKRDCDVDSVLPLVAPDVRLHLLHYLDFRMESDLAGKRQILIDLYKVVIENDQAIYEGATKGDDFPLRYQNKLYNKIKILSNRTDIRHGGEDKAEFHALSEAEKHEWYDKCFYLLIQLIRTPKSIEDMRSIKDSFTRKK